MKRSWIPLAILLCGVSAVWIYFVICHPLQFWAVDEEGTIMSIAQAINIDFWLSEGGKRGLSQAQFYQPGIWFQIFSWLVYRLTSADWSVSPMELFRATILEPSRFWFGGQIMPLVLSSFSLCLYWKRLRSFGVAVTLAGLSVYFVCVSAIHYGIFIPWNESFSLPLAFNFFLIAFRLLQTPKPKWYFTFLVGALGSLLYLHKMNYVVWVLALIPAWIAQVAMGERRFADLVKDTAIYMLGLATFAYALGNLFLSREGFAKMIASHIGIFFGTGLYGGGDQTVIKGSVLLQNFQSLIQQDFFTLGFVLIFALAVPFLIWKNRNHQLWLRQHVPALIFLWVALVIMTLAVLKHFQLQYTVSVAALFPLFVVTLARAQKARWLPFLLPIIVGAIFYNLKVQVTQRRQDLEMQSRVLADEAQILAMKLGDGQDRLWMYRSTTPTFQRLFSLAFSGLEERLLPVLDEVQGKQRLISPWNTTLMTPHGIVEINNAPWQYIVVPKIALQLWIDKKVHPWIADTSLHPIELRENIVFQRTQVVGSPAQPGE